MTGTVGGDNGDFTGNVYLRQKMDYFGTVRGRLGVASDTLLLYATGGLAWGRVNTTFGVNNIVSGQSGELGPRTRRPIRSARHPAIRASAFLSVVVWNGLSRGIGRCGANTSTWILARATRSSFPAASPNPT